MDLDDAEVNMEKGSSLEEVPTSRVLPPPLGNIIEADSPCGKCCL